MVGKITDKKKQIKLEFLCLILLADRTKCVNPNDRNTSPNLTLSFAFAEILFEVSVLFVVLQPHLVVGARHLETAIYLLPVPKYPFLQGHLDHLR